MLRCGGLSSAAPTVIDVDGRHGESFAKTEREEPTCIARLAFFRPPPVRSTDPEYFHNIRDHSVPESPEYAERVERPEYSGVPVKLAPPMSMFSVLVLMCGCCSCALTSVTMLLVSCVGLWLSIRRQRARQSPPPRISPATKPPHFQSKWDFLQHISEKPGHFLHNRTTHHKTACSGFDGPGVFQRESSALTGKFLAGISVTMGPINRLVILKDILTIQMVFARNAKAHAKKVILLISLETSGSLRL